MNYDPIESCPYDPVHRIMRSRMQYHLSKCAKNFPKSKKKQCPYDARHIVNEIEFSYHISVCPQRESVIRYKIVENVEKKPIPKILPIDSTPAAPITEENWEEDTKFNSYDPMKHTENRPVIRMLAGAQKAERKKYQKEERLRISKLEEEEKIEKVSVIQNNINQSASSLIKSTIHEQASAETEEEYKPLRRPKKLPLDSSKLSDFTTMNDSTIANETQNSINQNDSLQSVKQEKPSRKENVTQQPREVHSYAAALKQHKNNSFESDYDVVILSENFDNKDDNASFCNSTIDENLSLVSKTVEELTIGAKGHKEQAKYLDKALESLKKVDNNKSAIGTDNKSNNTFTTQRRSSRCAANFSNLKI